MNRRKSYQNSWRPAAQAPPARAAPPNQEEVNELRRQLQKQLRLNALQSYRLRQMEEDDQQHRALKIKVRELQEELDKHLQENNNNQKWRVRELVEVVQQKEALILELQKELDKAVEEKESIVEYGKTLLNTVREGVNQYVAKLYEENETLKTFSREQQAIAHQTQCELEEMEESSQCLQDQVEMLESNSADVLEELKCTTDTIEVQDVIILNLTQELGQYKADNRALERKLQEATMEAESSAKLLTSTQTELQKEQEEKQALQVQLLVLESVLAEQRQMAQEAESKALQLEESLIAQRSKVQELQTDQDSQKRTFMAALEKCSGVHNALVEQSSQQEKKVKELSTALTHSEEERTSALLRCEELQMSLKESEDQLQQTKGIAEELHATMDKKKKRRLFKWWQ